MKNSLLVLFSFGLFFSKLAAGEDDLNIEKGTFPFMAFVYYDDPTVINTLGERVIRSAVLIRENWLVTSAIISSDDHGGFPKKTLVARVGAINVDGNFTLNEDEDEQEREVIQIVRPYNHSATQWWSTDISLLKTLFPFNVTKVVNYKVINEKNTFSEKTCIILFYDKLHENSDERALTQSFVEVLEPTVENCGAHFVGSSMACAADKGDDNNTAVDFCHGNSGGPLICEGEVMGIQTYIENSCKEPHLYQLLSAWDTFVVCGIEEKCDEEQCSHICDVTNKDPIEEPSSIVPTHSIPYSSPLTLTTVTLEMMTLDGEKKTTKITTTPSVTPDTESQPTSTAETATVAGVNETKDTTTSVTTTTTVSVTESSADDITVAISTIEVVQQKESHIFKIPPKPKIPPEPNSERESPETQHMLLKKIKKRKKKNNAIKHLCSIQTLVFGLILGMY